MWMSCFYLSKLMHFDVIIMYNSKYENIESIWYRHDFIATWNQHVFLREHDVAYTTIFKYIFVHVFFFLFKSKYWLEYCYSNLASIKWILIHYSCPFSSMADQKWLKMVNIHIVRVYDDIVWYTYTISVAKNGKI